MKFRQAILRKPGSNFASGLTTSTLGSPDFDNALMQHQAYSQALIRCGVKVEILEPDLDYPDSTFVEDTAILAKGVAILSRPGAPSRLGEVSGIKPVLERYFKNFEFITPPGTLDGGDICEAGDHYFIGVSERTNEYGAHQLAEILTGLGFSTSLVDIHKVPGILHLKSGFAYLDNGHIVIIDALAEHPAFQKYNLIRIQPHENYAANCILVNDQVLVASGYPVLAAKLEDLGYAVILVQMSEFQKMDGGLSCLSLRF